MPRQKGQKNARELNDKQVKALKCTARVSKNLSLQVGPTGTKSWLMEWADGGKRHWMGLGAYPEVTLAKARERVQDARRSLAGGIDPRKPIAKYRFRDVAALWIKKQTPEWTNQRYARQVPSYLAQHVFPKLGEMDVAAIQTADVYSVLHPIWLTINQTAVVIRGYIEQVLAYANAMGWRTGENPARWKANLEFLLAAPGKVSKPEKWPSLHPEQIGEFMLVLRTLEGASFRALELLIHAGLRSNEVAGARWDEIDFERGVWSLPAERMKERVAHTVPLSPQAVALLQALPREGEVVFGIGANDMRRALAAVFKEAGRIWNDKQSGKLIVVHGFRASLSTWGRDQGYDETMIEVVLAHAVGTEVARRYQRSDMVERRAGMMAAWSAHLMGT